MLMLIWKYHVSGIFLRTNTESRVERELLSQKNCNFMVESNTSVVAKVVKNKESFS